MNAPKLIFTGVVLPLLVGCVVEQRDFEALRDQVRLQQKQINDLKARQEEQTLRIDTVNNGFKILGDKAEDNARRIDELSEQGFASRPPISLPPPEAPPLRPAPAAPSLPAPAYQPEPPVAAAPASPAISPAPPSGAVLLTNLPKAGVPDSPPAGEIITAAPKPEKLYAAALALYSGREYQQAAAKFREFVSTYPEHKLAGNAQYWIGECSYSQRRFAEAAEEFDRVEKVFPASPKIPAALLKKGLSLGELKRVPEAQEALQRITERYPQSEEAAKARERLERWRQQ